MTRQSNPVPPSNAGISRRSALTGATTAGLALPLLAACGEGVSSAVDSPVGSASSPGTTSGSAASSAGGSGGALASVDDIPVGGGRIFTDDRVVVTQPVAGELRCFSAVCTHEQCLVTDVTSEITCRCHSSTFDLSTGEVLGGPAPAPLPAVDFTITQNQVVLS